MGDKERSRLIERIKRISGSAASRQLGVFLIFVVISAVLWIAMSLNEEVQRDIVCNVRVVNVPDSVTFITEPPSRLHVNVRARGTQMIRHLMGYSPTVEIDFRYYNRDNKFEVSRADLRSMVQMSLGDNKAIQAVSPDTIGVYYTTLAPLCVPVKVCAHVSTTVNSTLYGPVVPLTDSVKVYAANNKAEGILNVKTQAVTIGDISHDCTRRVALVAPSGCRVIPDSIDLRITVEPVVTKTMSVAVTPVNVPPHFTLTLEQPHIDVKYRVPQSRADEVPEVSLFADFQSIPNGRLAGKVSVKSRQVHTNILIGRDSIGYALKPVENETEQTE